MNEAVKQSDDLNRATGLRRRQFLAASGAVAVSAMVGSFSIARAAGADQGYVLFMNASTALTGDQHLSDALGHQIWKGFLALDSKNSEVIEQLAAVLKDQPEIKINTLDAAVQPLAHSILKAWYLGIVGDGTQSHVVAYEHALMYAPLADVCVLPTYARGEPHYWAHPPAIAPI